MAINTNKLYVTEYGSWGQEYFEVFDTTKWTYDDFDEMDAASDYDKLPLAREITALRNKEAN